jgi:RsiW-degrading membrane proteinase PrsW (M82 family)
MVAPLRRRRISITAAAVVLSLLVVATFVHLGLLVGTPSDVAQVFVRALMLSSALSVVPLWVLWSLDRRERETPWIFAAAMLWGGLIATAIALPFNTAFFRVVDLWLTQHPTLAEALGPDAAMLVAAPISAPIAEEIAKALGVLVVFWLLRGEFDSVRDGVVYGALVGLGFNWFESALYVAQGYAQSGVAPYGLQLGGRFALLGLGGHAMFTAIFGALLGVALATRRRWLRVVAPMAGILLAIQAHVLNNVLPLAFALASAAIGESPPMREPPSDMGFLDAFISASLLQLVIFLPFVAIIALALWRGGLKERRVIREELAEELGRTISEDEYKEIEADRLLRTRRIDRRRPELSAALVTAEHELAFRKRRLRDEGNDPERDRVTAAWREDIRRLQAAM